MDDDIDPIDACIACLGDDAAVLRDENEDCEIAANMDEAARIIDRLRAENEALRRDAERYRWLRRPDRLSRPIVCSDYRHDEFECYTPEALDAEIDAALAVDQPGAAATRALI